MTSYTLLVFRVEKVLKLFSIGFFICEAGTVLMTP